MIGGDVRESVRKGLTKIFSNKVATKCSYYGRKQNYPIKNLDRTIISKGDYDNFVWYINTFE